MNQGWRGVCKRVSDSEGLDGSRSGGLSAEQAFQHGERVLVSFVFPVRGDPAGALELAHALITHAHEEGLASGEIEILVAVADDDEERAGEILGGRNGQKPPGPVFEQVRVVRCPHPSRGGQMLLGAAEATGGLLVFHHADNPLTKDHLRSLLRVAREGKVSSGAFFRDLGHGWPGLGIVMPLARWWQRKVGILYGDQTCFVKKDVYDAVGGMPDIVLMEDVAFSKKLRRWGEVELLDPPVCPDMSRFSRDGHFRRKLENLALICFFKMGVSPTRLRRIYDRE